ncbi:MAG: hypothetical protein EKK54_01295 [Neisseriaceae bacterium]|nr:MAG: hypothetical protein EKK54_01295 [Neisseriaceae bacterium]
MYKLIKPEDFTKEHVEHIENFKKMIKMLSDSTDTLMGAKDINSRHIISTTSHSKIVGLNRCGDVTGRLDSEMPCDGTAQYAEQFVQVDKSLLTSQDVKRGVVILNIHNYGDGTKARIFKKFLLKHDDSQSILGTIYSGQDIDLTDVLNIMPNYITQFGKTGNIKVINKNDNLLNDITLTEYEQEICFLFLLNWNFKQIANFMNYYRPIPQQRTIDTIIKKKNYICNKFRLNSTLLTDLQEFLVSINFHNKIPLSFLGFIVGATTLKEISL